MGSPFPVLPETRYEEWRRLSGLLTRRESRQFTYSATALLHEALMRLRNRDLDGMPKGDAERYLRTTMQHILIDRARRRAIEQRHRAESPAASGTGTSTDTHLSVRKALQDLAQLDPRQAAVVEMREILGLSNEEIAERLGCSVRSVCRDWKTARLWLRRELSGV